MGKGVKGEIESGESRVISGLSQTGYGRKEEGKNILS